MSYRVRLSRFRIVVVAQGAGQYPAAPRVERQAEKRRAGAGSAPQAAGFCEGVGGNTVSSGGACGPAAPDSLLSSGTSVPSGAPRGAAASRPCGAARRINDLPAHDGQATPANGVRRLESDGSSQSDGPERLRFSFRPPLGPCRTAPAGDKWLRHEAAVQIGDRAPERAVYFSWEGGAP